jgi:hypothetical protein
VKCVHVYGLTLISVCFDLRQILVRHYLTNPFLYTQHTSPGNLALALYPSRQVDDKSELEVDDKIEHEV